MLLQAVAGLAVIAISADLQAARILQVYLVPCTEVAFRHVHLPNWEYGRWRGSQPCQIRCLSPSILSSANLAGKTESNGRSVNYGSRLLIPVGCTGYIECNGLAHSLCGVTQQSDEHVEGEGLGLVLPLRLARRPIGLARLAL